MYSIGAATSDGNQWSKVGDNKPDFYLPGVDLSIPVESVHSIIKNESSDKWHKYSGSSLSCVLASWLAAMILYCALEVKSDQRLYINQHEGRKEAFESISESTHMRPSRWPRVSSLCGHREIKAVSPRNLERVPELVVDRCLSRNKPEIVLSQRKT